MCFLCHKLCNIGEQPCWVCQWSDHISVIIIHLPRIVHSLHKLAYYKRHKVVYIYSTIYNRHKPHDVSDIAIWNTVSNSLNSVLLSSYRRLFHCDGYSMHSTHINDVTKCISHTGYAVGGDDGYSDCGGVFVWWGGGVNCAKEQYPVVKSNKTI